MKKLIDADKLYEKTAKLEAQALEQVNKYNPVDSRDEWRWWSAILAERTAFKYDIIDAPDIATNKWIKIDDSFETFNIPDHEVLCVDKYGEELIGWLDQRDDQWLCESESEILFDPVAWMEKPKFEIGE